MNFKFINKKTICKFNISYLNIIHLNYFSYNPIYVFLNFVNLC